MGHGDHWTIIDGSAEATITNWLPEIIAKGRLLSMPRTSDPGPEALSAAAPEACAITYPDSALRGLALIVKAESSGRGAELWSA